MAALGLQEFRDRFVRRFYRRAAAWTNLWPDPRDPGSTNGIRDETLEHHEIDPAVGDQELEQPMYRNRGLVHDPVSGDFVHLPRGKSAVEYFHERDDREDAAPRTEKTLLDWRTYRK